MFSGLTMCSRRLLVPRFFLFSAFGAIARSKSGVAVAVSFRQNFILSTIGGVFHLANKIFDVAKWLLYERISGSLIVLHGVKTANLR